jgi:hypothetical protein
MFNTYLLGLAQINNEEMLEKFTVASLTSMKEEDRKSLHKKTFKAAFPNEFNKPKNVVKLSDLRKALA